MKVQAEVSLYPLRTPDLAGGIDAFVEHLRAAGVGVSVGPLSSRVTGRCPELFRALGEAFEHAARGADAVLTIKVSNACPDGGEENRRDTDDESDESPQ